MLDPCSELREKLADCLEPEEIAALCEAARMHLGSCPDCNLVVDREKKLITIVRSGNEVPLPSGLGSRLETFLADVYRREPEGGSSD